MNRSMRSAVITALLFLAAMGCGSAGSKPTPLRSSGYFLSDDGLRLKYRVIGHGARTVVVPLIHWNTDQFAAIAGDDFRFVFYDPRNRGESDASPDTTRLSMEHDLYDLGVVQRLLDVKKISLIGTSYYGGLVARYAMLYPDKVDRVVLVGPIPLEGSTLYAYDPPEKKMIIKPEDVAALEKLRRDGVENYDPERYCRAYWEQENRLSVGQPSWGSRVATRCENPNEWPRNFLAWSNQVIGSLGRWDWRPSARKMLAPTLVIHGTHDWRVPLEASRDWVRTLPDSRLLVLDGAGHTPWFGRPESIFPEVRTFLLGSWPTGIEGGMGDSGK